MRTPREDHAWSSWSEPDDRDVRVVFIESDPELAAKLALNVEPFRRGGRHVSVLCGDVHSRITEAWGLVAGQPVVTFLDPFGVAMQRDTMCKVLLNRSPKEHPSEVLLNINLEAVRRIGGNLELRTNGDVVPKAGQEAGVARADAFFGGAWWQRQFFENRLDSRSAALAASAVIDDYRCRIKSLTGRDSMSIEVRRRPNHVPLFLLTLFYSHPVAGYKFADAAARATASWRAAFLFEELEEMGQEPETLFGREFDMALIRANFERQEKRLRQEWVDLICSNITQSPAPALTYRATSRHTVEWPSGRGEPMISRELGIGWRQSGQITPRTQAQDIHKQWIVPHAAHSELHRLSRISSQPAWRVLPSAGGPPAWARRLWQASRSRGPIRGSSGRAFGPDSPPVMTHPIPDRSIPAGAMEGADENLTAAGLPGVVTRSSRRSSTLTPIRMGGRQAGRIEPNEGFVSIGAGARGVGNDL